MVERPAVNRNVDGSSPSWGASFSRGFAIDTRAYYVYVLQNPHGRLYVGFTTDLDKRVRPAPGGQRRLDSRTGPVGVGSMGNV